MMRSGLSGDTRDQGDVSPPLGILIGDGMDHERWCDPTQHVEGQGSLAGPTGVCTGRMRDVAGFGVWLESGEHGEPMVGIDVQRGVRLTLVQSRQAGAILEALAVEGGLPPAPRTGDERAGQS